MAPSATAQKKKGRKKMPRLLTPLVRKNGELVEATWDEALDVAAAGLAAHRGTSSGMFSCSKSNNEMNFLAQKFARLAMNTNNIDSCNRT
jgi:predicted molibdopterin-dependent oxidoreductase YjgC